MIAAHSEQEVSQDDFEDDYFGLNFYRGGTAGKEYMVSEAVIDTPAQSYRLRLQELDDGIRIDLWEGEYDAESEFFSPKRFVESAYDQDLGIDDMPLSSESFEEFTEDYFAELLS